MSRTLLFWIIASFTLLGLILWGLPYLWDGLGAGMSGHGWFAYIIMGVVTLALSGGLFLLTFFSSRHGYDDIDRPEDGPGAG